jgi:glucan 1,3-beta-glucosidase
VGLFFTRDYFDRPHRAIYGVNLGGWLVLERWITPGVFKGLAADEYTLCKEAEPDVLATIKKHRDTFITLNDFKWLSEHGIEAVRLPVGHGVFGDFPPYSKTINHVDKAFTWAQKTGLRIILDLHTAPGSQNGRQESGMTGEIGWHKDDRHIAETLQVIHKLAQRYGKRKSLLGIELLNEPSSKIPKRKLVKFYRDAYRLVRQECGEDVWVIYSDAYRPRRYSRILRSNKYRNVYIDTHQYQTFSWLDRRRRILSHIRKSLRTVPRRLYWMGRHHPVIIGEWSMTLDPQSLTNLHVPEKSAATRAFGAAQQLAYERTAAWFYWTYKTEHGGAWSYRDSIETGMLAMPDRTRGVETDVE